MSTPHLPIQRVLIVAALASALSACVTMPVNAGYVSFNPDRTDKLLVGAQAGVSLMEPSPGEGGAVHVEPFVSGTTSVPVSLMGFVGRFGGGGGTGRVGLRYRLSDWASVGGGGSIGFGTNVTGPDPTPTRTNVFGLHLDVEASIGEEWDWIGISVTPRATLVIDTHMVVGYFPIEVAVALFPVRNVAITLHAIPTLLIGSPMGVAFGTGIGVLVRG